MYENHEILSEVKQKENIRNNERKRKRSLVCNIK